MQLREQRETIEGLVDDVVECYHNGFAKAIHNYSQILQLFSDSKAQVRDNRLERYVPAYLHDVAPAREPNGQSIRALSVDSIPFFASQVDTVKQNLGDTKRRLGTQSRHLLQQARVVDVQSPHSPCLLPRNRQRGHRTCALRRSG